MLGKTTFLEVLKKSALYLYITISTVAFFVLPQNNELAYRQLLWVMYIYIIVASRILNSMQIAHTSNEDFFQVQYFPILVGLALNIFTVVACATT